MEIISSKFERAEFQAPPLVRRKKYDFNIEVFAKNDQGRGDVEGFIEQGFLRSYNAKISISMPWILAISNGSFKAALGIRSAKETLFIEQYTDKPIEQILEVLAPKVHRSEIAEVGHLYSNSKKFTLPLFLTTAVSLFCNHYQYMVFAATEHVLDLIDRTGITHTMITHADPSKLSQSANNWGAYYQTNPKVVAISLSDVMAVINNSKKFRIMFERLDNDIACATKKLQDRPL